MTWQPDIDDCDLGMSLQRLLHRLLSVFRELDGVPGHGEVHLHGFAVVGAVIDDEDPPGAAGSSEDFHLGGQL